MIIENIVGVLLAWFIALVFYMLLKNLMLPEKIVATVVVDNALWEKEGTREKIFAALEKLVESQAPINIYKIEINKAIEKNN